MREVRISEIAAADKNLTVIRFHRKISAFLSLLFPLSPVIILVIGLMSGNLTLFKILSHSGIMFTIPPAIIGMSMWLRIFWPSAFMAIFSRRDAVKISGKLVWFFDRNIEWNDETMLFDDGMNVGIKQGDDVLTSRKAFYIKSDILDICR